MLAWPVSHPDIHCAREPPHPYLGWSGRLGYYVPTRTLGSSVRVQHQGTHGTHCCPIPSINSSSLHRHPPLLPTDSPGRMDLSRWFPAAPSALRDSNFTGALRLPTTASPSFAALTSLPSVSTPSLSLPATLYSLHHFHRGQPNRHFFRDIIHLFICSLIH